MLDCSPLFTTCYLHDLEEVTDTIYHMINITYCLPDLRRGNETPDRSN